MKDLWYVSTLVMAVLASIFLPAVGVLFAISGNPNQGLFWLVLGIYAAWMRLEILREMPEELKS